MKETPLHPLIHIPNPRIPPIFHLKLPAEVLKELLKEVGIISDQRPHILDMLVTDSLARSIRILITLGPEPHLHFEILAVLVDREVKAELPQQREGRCQVVDIADEFHIEELVVSVADVLDLVHRAVLQLGVED